MKHDIKKDLLVNSLHAQFTFFVLFYGCFILFSLPAALHVSSEPDLLCTDFVTDDPTGWLPKKLHLPPGDRGLLFVARIRTHKCTVS